MAGAGLVEPAGGVGLEDAADFIAHAPEDGELGGLVAGGVRRVVEPPVVPVALAWKDRARLVGIAADGDDGFDVEVPELVEVFRVVVAEVDADFGHRADGERVDEAGGIRAGAGHGEAGPEGVAQDAFGEVGPARVAGAEDEDEGL